MLDDKLFKRNDYEFTKFTNSSSKNEPIPLPFDCVADHLMMSRYPDMKTIYDLFSKYFHINQDNFILTNDCDESLRICLSIIKRLQPTASHFIGETPGWKMADIIANQFFDKDNITDNQYKVKKDMVDGQLVNIVYQDKVISMDGIKKLCHTNDPKDTVLYTTDHFNNYFKHERNSISYTISDPKVWMITDETYTLRSLIDTVFKEREGYEDHITRNNKFYIGSLSKVLGCGIRLGYIVFHSDYKDIFNLFRPQYLGIGPTIITNALLNDKSGQVTSAINQRLSIFLNNTTMNSIPNKEDTLGTIPGLYCSVLAVGNKVLPDRSKEFELEDANNGKVKCIRYGVSW